MSDSSCNFFINSSFNANFDITWSFKYSVTGSNNSSGGFSTFLFDINTLSGGGSHSGLGFGPYQSENGVNGAKIGILFDSDNTITVKNGTTFDTITSFPLNTLLYPLIKSTESFNTIRFNFTNVAQSLKIAVKNQNNRYVDIANVNTGLTAKDTDFYKIGFGYASPIKSGDDKTNFKIKDIHVQGNTAIPKTKYKKKPYIILGAETFYILQSPLSGKINIANPDPTSVGSLMHK
jgi:hypothetical protein